MAVSFAMKMCMDMTNWFTGYCVIIYKKEGIFIMKIPSESCFSAIFL